MKIKVAVKLIVVQDSITTGPFWECPTSCGAFALKDAIAKDDAELVKRVRCSRL